MYDKQSPFAATTRPERRNSFTTAAYATLRASIIDCQLPPGRAVSEAELSAKFAFGLAAVRAAVMRLTAAGWIAPDGRRGSMVLPISAEHLADLAASRLCLEPNLLHHSPSAGLAEELCLRATVFQAPSTDRLALLHQERAFLSLIAEVIAAPRIRSWLIDTWELCLRADRHLEQEFGIVRDPLPLGDLATALAEGRGTTAAQILTQMRDAFDLRISRALSRSGTALTAAAQARKSASRGAAATARPIHTPRPRSAKGDPA